MKHIDKKTFDEQVYFDLCFGKTYQTKLSPFASKRWFKLNLRLKGFRVKEQFLNNLCGFDWNNSRYIITKQCKYCKKEIEKKDAVLARGYWTAGKVISLSHKDCAEGGYKDEVYECQKIDANCNECGFLKRGKENLCKKTGDVVFPSSNYAMGMECFVHRKDYIAPE